VVSLLGGVDLPTIPISLNNFGPVSGNSGIVKLPRVSLRAVDPNIDTAYAHFWSLSLERQVFYNAVAKIEWSGSKGVNLYDISNINRPGGGAIFFGDASPTSRLNQQFSNINFRGSSGFSNYNALILSLQTPLIKRYGLQFTTNYTWSHALDNLSTTFSESLNNQNLGYLDPFNPKLDYGDAEFDIRHRFVVGLLWDVPPPTHWDNKWAHYLLNGWTFTSLFTAHSGTPFTIFDCTNALTACNRLIQNGPIKTTGDHPPADPTVPDQFQWISLAGVTPGTFANPITGTSDFGPFPANMTGRDRFRGPGFWNLDSGLYKAFHFTERYSLQLRWEVYNVFNHANMFIIGAEAEQSLGLAFVPSFFRGRRNVQLAARFNF
jgi:hypothetical protein